MTRIAFFDDNKEILVGNVVDHIVDEKSWFCPEFHDLDKYPEIASFFNEILVDVEVEDEKLREYIILQLRLISGLNIEKTNKLFYHDDKNAEFNVEKHFEKEIAKMIDYGLLEIKDGYMRLTTKGLDLANVVWEEFI